MKEASLKNHTHRRRRGWLQTTPPCWRSYVVDAATRTVPPDPAHSWGTTVARDSLEKCPTNRMVWKWCRSMSDTTHCQSNSLFYSSPQHLHLRLALPINTVANPLFRCQPFGSRLDWSPWAWHIPAWPLQPPPRPRWNPHPHLLRDYHVIPDCRQPGRSRGRFITIQHSLSSCRRAAGLMSVGWAGGGAEGWRGSTDLSPQASINCLMCRRAHLTIQTEVIWLWPWAVWRRMQTRRRGFQVPFVHQKYKKRKFLGGFVVTAAAAALRSEQGSRFWLLVPGPRQGFLWWLAKRWS